MLEALLTTASTTPDKTLIVIMVVITLMLAVAWLTAEIRKTMRSDDQPDNFIECRRTYTQHGLSDGTNPRHARYSGR